MTPAPTSTRTLSSVDRIHEDARQYPRIVLNRPVDVMKRDGTTVAAMLYDVSADAVQIRTTREAAAKLHPTGRFIQPEDAPEVILRLRLPVNGASIHLVMRTQMTYFVLREDGDVGFGLRFRDLGDNRAKLIGRFIEESPLYPEAEIDFGLAFAKVA